MDELAHEILLEIIKYLDPKSSYALGVISKSYMWILYEYTIWQAFAKTNLKCPSEVFDELLQDNKIALKTYLDIHRCHNYTPVQGTHFMKRCRCHIVPETPYCKAHCHIHGIEICKWCENNIREKLSSYCLTCLTTQAYLDGCKYVYLRGYRKGQQCGDKKMKGSDYCQSCSRKIPKPKPEPKPEPQPEPNNELEVFPWYLDDFYKIASGSLMDIIIVQKDNITTALGRYFEGNPNINFDQQNVEKHLIPLTEVDKVLLRHLGIAYKN